MVSLIFIYAENGSACNYYYISFRHFGTRTIAYISSIVLDVSCLLFVCYTYVLYAIHVGIVDHNIILFYDLRRHRSLVVSTAMQLHV